MRKMKTIKSHEWTNPDGCKCTLTVSTADGAPISEEDQAFIRRLVPMAAEEVINAVAPEKP